MNPHLLTQAVHQGDEESEDGKGQEPKVNQLLILIKPEGKPASDFN